MKIANPLRRGRAIGLFVQVLVMLLVVMAVVQTANAVMVLTVPPPQPELYRLDEVVAVLKGDRSAASLERLKVETRARPPATRASTAPPNVGPNLDAMIVKRLEERLGVPASHIQYDSGRSPRTLLRRMRLIRNAPPAPGQPRPQLGFARRPPDAGSGPRPPSPEGDDPRRDFVRPSQRAPEGGFAMREGIGFFDPPVIAPFKVGVLQPDGGWLVVESRQSFPTPWQQRILLWLLVSASLCVPLAYGYARWLAAPIRRFAEAAERLGSDPGASELEVSGPAEVRLAGEAFNRMQERLQRYIENRTTLVGAVAHDLRTPLARMRFLLETPPVEDMRARLGREIDEMDAMVAATLAFVRDSTTKAVRVDLDLPSLLESLADDAAEEGHGVSLGALAPAVVHADPVGLRRLFDNLIRNGVKFATMVQLTLRIEGDDAVVEVADNGPGLPAHDLERVFEPFYRGEASRNRETGGMGLGLAVVRSIARAHGGDAVLANRPEGGLICRVRLPLRAIASRPA